MGGSSFSTNNPLVVSLFHHSVFQTSVSWIIALALVTLVLKTWVEYKNTALRGTAFTPVPIVEKSV